jgi:hypothetical protein
MLLGGSSDNLLRGVALITIAIGALTSFAFWACVAARQSQQLFAAVGGRPAQQKR